MEAALERLYGMLGMAFFVTWECTTRLCRDATLIPCVRRVSHFGPSIYTCSGTLHFAVSWPCPFDRPPPSGRRDPSRTTTMAIAVWWGTRGENGTKRARHSSGTKPFVSSSSTMSHVLAPSRNVEPGNFGDGDMTPHHCHSVSWNIPNMDGDAVGLCVEGAPDDPHANDKAKVANSILRSR